MFTDTIYDDTAIQAEVTLNTAKVSNVDHPLVETAVPIGALFTDTIYDDTAIQAEVTLNTAKVSNVDHPLVETAVPIGALFTDTIYDDTAIQAEVTLNTAKVSNVDHPLVETAVPIGALFTDTIYDDTAIQAEVTLNTAKVSNVDHPLVETAVPIGALFTDTIYDDTAIQAEVTLNTAKVSNVDHPLVETAVPIGALFTDTIYDDTAIQAEVTLNTTYRGIGHIPNSEKAANNGVATLDGGGKIPATQLPSTVMEFKGSWNALTNTPTLIDGTGDNGDVYLVIIAGTQDLGSGPQTFLEGDWVVYSGSIWEKSLNSSAVISVNSQVGVVVLDADDIDDTATTNKFATSAELAAIVVNTAKVSNVDHPLVETAVPVGAVFTDTVYDDTAIQAEVTLNTAKVSNVAHPLVETAVPVGALFTDTDTVYDDTAIQAEVTLNTTDRHTHSNKANLDVIDQDLSTTDDVEFNTVIAGDAAGEVAKFGDSTFAAKWINVREGVGGGKFGMDASGRVGIQTGSAKPFHVRVNRNSAGFDLASADLEINTSGNAKFRGNLEVNTITATGDSNTLGNHVFTSSALELNSADSGDRNSFIDFHSSDSVDNSARIIRNSGVNGDLNITNTGTGSINIDGMSGTKSSDDYRIIIGDVQIVGFRRISVGDGNQAFTYPWAFKAGTTPNITLGFSVESLNQENGKGGLIDPTATNNTQVTVNRDNNVSDSDDAEFNFVVMGAAP